MLSGIFGKKRPTETLTFAADVRSDYRGHAKEAIERGRYLVFAPVADGRAVLLLGTSPRLVASVLRQTDASGRAAMIVEWVCEASADHRDQLAVDNFDGSCRDDALDAEQAPM